MTTIDATASRAAARAAGAGAGPGAGPAVARVRIDPYPRRRRNRWLLRLLFSLPYVVVAILGERATAQTPPAMSTVNADLLARVARIDWTRADAAWVGDLYPPVGTVLAAITPGGTLGLGIVGALIAGPFLQQMLQAMQQRRFPPVESAMFMAALAANPLFAQMVTTNLEAFLGVAAFGVGATNMVRFVAYRNTQAGFRAGLLFALAALSSASGIVYIVVIGLAAPLVSLARRGERGARASNILVLLFPTLSAFLTVSFLQLVFLHRPFAFIEAQFHYDPALWATVPQLVTTLNGFLLLAPMISGWILALLVRRPGAVLISTLLFLGLLTGYILGLIPANSAGNTFFIMTMMGMAILPAATTRRADVLITVVAAVQIAIAWAAAYNRPVVLDWMGSIARVLGWA
ncbi:hypothetical protein [Clavibacter michiganensis]|uniref:hypothetical protein n=1 Tax=Clavibacter michiganensis TaxID=28447 RepID=UPI0009A8B5A1|nr:hypothetical protein [Clavibacter michiganensis]MBE3077809.1 hypothetical protein [Clavibacter michiganensis subsp. michiganensis]MBF4638330.1 hypothetical protein [Clavibacter michiganensis subsp. michiganensis]MDO4123431.1 hypothetical protein [Clavibacter michiganensis]MDO4138709.1 hypothetical protein [Clavibacter michiganensis]MWJ06165.1 hypothetical protein [Clavibacter michiganensis subsp. michiganensis]